ncbi:hypothetical protein A6B43_07130 [Vespertiliibacter pulmonis]|nr:hypothetical protein A6B43_07130 [Vespertiliibacter pulmonis]
MLFLVSIFCAFWFLYELKNFPLKINTLIYQNMSDLVSLDLTLEQLISHSKLQEKNSRLKNFILFLSLPILSLFLNHYPPTIITIIFILIYLSILDTLYYLTDSKYVTIIFIITLLHLVLFNEYNIYPYIISLLFTLIFFFLLIQITQFLLKKEVFGMGDVIILVAISPLFRLEEILLLLLIASLSGLIFASGYFLVKKEKLTKLPFIPFISFSTLLLLIIN